MVFRWSMTLLRKPFPRFGVLRADLRECLTSRQDARVGREYCIARSRSTLKDRAGRNGLVASFAGRPQGYRCESSERLAGTYCPLPTLRYHLWR